MITSGSKQNRASVLSACGISEEESLKATYARKRSYVSHQIGFGLVLGQELLCSLVHT